MLNSRNRGANKIPTNRNFKENNNPHDDPQTQIDPTNERIHNTPSIFGETTKIKAVPQDFL